MNAQSVLIIDDEPDIRELLEITLLRMGLKADSSSTQPKPTQPCKHAATTCA